MKLNRLGGLFVVAISVLALSLFTEHKYLYTSFKVSAQELVGVPKIDPVPGQDVEVFWNNHPLNPTAPNGIGIGEVVSPSNTVNVKQEFGGDIQAAIDSLPSSGGTLFFEPGTYAHNFKLINKHNIHFVANPYNILDVSTQAKIVGGLNTSSSVLTNSNIATCDVALDYPTFNAAVYNLTNARHAEAIDCLNNRQGGFYFKNLVFDGGNTAQMAFMIRASRDIVFDSVTFQNFVDPTIHHAGNVNANSVVENIWCRSCNFRGKQRYAWYVDGAHGSGVINSTIDAKYGSGAFLFLTNDDLTSDWNNDGVYSFDESRISNYIIVEGNHFHGAYNMFHGSTAYSLIKNNVVTGANAHLAHFFIRHPSNTPVEYEFFHNKVINNTTNKNLSYLVRVGGPPSTCNRPYCAKIGQYDVHDNVLKNINQSTFQGIVFEDSSAVPLIGPSSAQNNCVNGVIYGTTDVCNLVTSDRATNVILNGSFETDVDANYYPDSWWQRIPLSRTTEIAHEGIASLKILGHANWPYLYVFQQPYAPQLVAQNTYTLKAWVNVPEVIGRGVQLRYALYQPAGTIYETPWVKNTGGWVEIQKTFTLPSNYGQGRLDINWNLLPGEEIFVDDVRLCEGTGENC